MGHFVRCQALAEAALDRGHRVAWSGLGLNNETGSQKCYSDIGDQFNLAVSEFQPDWTVVDLPGPIPAYVAGVRGRLCIIDGLGHENGLNPDLSISQGFEGEYCAPKYLILRQALERYKKTARGDRWLVFGGASDELGLLPAFNRVMADEPADLLTTDFGTIQTAGERNKHRILRARGDAVLGWLAGAGRACIHLGVTAWELAYLGVPFYVFSRSERHLETALAFDDLGYGLAWEKVGLPKDGNLWHFLTRFRNFEPYGEPFDLDGAGRIIELMEEG